MKFYKEELGLPNIDMTSVSWSVDLVVKKELSEDIIKYASANHIDSRDLYPISAVYVSTNWNANADIFLKEEVWAARNTVKNHPINIDHKTLDIVGHMTDVAAFTYDGALIDDATVLEDLPEEFDLICNGFIYTEWNNPERETEILQMIQDIEDSSKACSMECVFTNFDYALKYGEEVIIVPRNEESAFLTKFLRRYGGTGKYQQYEIGRVLRNMSFVGKGIVDRPANKRSVFIHNNVDKNKIITQASEKFITNVVNANMENIMSEELAKLNEKVNELIQKVDMLSVEKDNIKTLLDQTQTSLVEANVNIADYQKVIANFEAEKVTLLSDKTNLETKVAELEAKINEMTTQAKLEARANQLVVGGLDNEEASTKVKLFANLSDDQWSEVAKAFLVKPAKQETVAEVTVEDIKNTVADNQSTASITESETSNATDEQSKNEEVRVAIKEKMKQFLKGKK